MELKFLIEDIDLTGGGILVKYISPYKDDEATITTLVSLPAHHIDRDPPAEEEILSLVKLNFPFSYFEERKKQNDFAKKHSQQEIYKNIIKKETVFQKEEIDKIVENYVADKHHRDQILSQERYLFY